MNEDQRPEVAQDSNAEEAKGQEEVKVEEEPIPQCPVFKAQSLEEFRDFQGFLEKCVSASGNSAIFKVGASHCRTL